MSTVNSWRVDLVPLSLISLEGTVILKVFINLDLDVGSYWECLETEK